MYDDRTQRDTVSETVDTSGDQPPATPAAPSAPASSPPAAGSEASATSAAPQAPAIDGAPGRKHLVGNTHRATHGVWSFLALGKLPKGGAYIRRLLGELRRELETRVNAAHGEISLGNAALVTTVCRHEGRALLLSRYLALEAESLKLLDRMTMLEAIGRATDARDKAIRALDLDRDTEAFDFKAFYAEPLPTEPAPASVLPPPTDEYARPHPGAVPDDNATASEFGGQAR